MALLRGTAAPRSGELRLRNREMEVGALAPLCALVKVRRDYNWVRGGSQCMIIQPHILFYFLHFRVI